MTDHDQPDEREFDDPAYDDVRDLLASAKVTDPIPADVAARLEDTLASLTADRRGNPPDRPAVVVPLRRRSRVAPRLLAAAAAVVILGAGSIGVSEVLRDQGADQLTAGTADSATTEESDGLGPAAPQAPAPGPKARDEALDGILSDLQTTRGSLASNKAVPRFTAAGFTAEVAAFSTRNLRLPWEMTAETGSLDAGTGAGADPDQTPSPSPGPTSPLAGVKGSTPERVQRNSQYFAAKAACPGPVGTDATLVPVLYNGRPASLAVYPEQRETQLYEAWSCDGRTLLALSIVPR